MMKENKKNDYVIKTNDQEEINGRIQEIYEKLNGLKTNISPTNNNQVNLAILTDFKDYLNQMLKCKKAISGDKIRMAGH
jgi:tetrahydrodipicolinate N-succinyltransferase